MSGFQKIRSITTAIVMLAAAIYLFIEPEGGYVLVITLLGLTFLGYGLGTLIYFVTMARHMVGGKMILLQGVLILDFAMFTGTLSGVPRFYAMLYLIGAHAFTGVVEVLRAIEAKSTVEGSWVPKLLHGVINILLALLCVIFSADSGTAVTIFSISLIYSALMQMISAFRRTAFVLIE